MSAVYFGASPGAGAKEAARRLGLVSAQVPGQCTQWVEVLLRDNSERDRHARADIDKASPSRIPECDVGASIAGWKLAYNPALRGASAPLWSAACIPPTVLADDRSCRELVRLPCMVVQLTYETHSRTIDNERGIATGWLPGELSADGRRFAQDPGRRWVDTDLAAVYTSDLRRAVQTAEIAFNGRIVTVITDRRLRECNYVALNGLPVARLEAERTQHIDTPYASGQNYRQVVTQMRAFLREAVLRHQNQTILVIAHSANRWALEGQLLEALLHAPF